MYRQISIYAIVLLLLAVSGCSPYMGRMVRVKTNPTENDKAVRKSTSEVAPNLSENTIRSTEAETVDEPQQIESTKIQPNKKLKRAKRNLVKTDPEVYSGLPSMEERTEPQDSIENLSFEKMIAIQQVRQANIWAWVSLASLILSLVFVFPLILALIGSKIALRKYSMYYVEGMPQYYMLARVVRTTSLVLLGLGVLLFLLIFISFLLLF